jgi:hypothetical protein
MLLVLHNNGGHAPFFVFNIFSFAFCIYNILTVLMNNGLGSSSLAVFDKMYGGVVVFQKEILI